jgi:AraC-like DNA-binding protein
LTILVDTNLAPSGDRTGYWRQAVERLFGAIVRVDTSTPLDARLAIHRLERVQLIELSGNPMTFTRAAGSTAVTITALAMLAGSAVLTQEAGRCTISAGELCLHASDAALVLELPERVHAMAVSVPAAEFLDLFPRGREALRTAIPAAAGAPALFVDQASTLLGRHNALDAATATAIANSIIHLLGAVACSVVLDNPNCAHRAREKIERVLRFARTHLRDPELDVETIAHAVHLSVRQVHRLFANEPMSLMQWVMTQRLQNCYRELRQSSTRNRSIGEIAYEWGFSDQAHFSRAFRKHFGRSPSEVRRMTSSANEAAAYAAPPDPFDLPECRACRFRARKMSV